MRVLLVGRGTHGMVEQLRRAVPRAELVTVDDPAAGERHLGEADAAIVSGRVTPAYARAKRLRWLHLTAAGIETQAIPELRDAPFTITHKAQASVAPMADHVMAQVLAFSRRLHEVRELQRERRWSEHGGPAEQAGDLRGKTIGIVGLGNVGLAIAKRARPFGMRVVGTKRSNAGRLPNVSKVYPPTGLREMLGEADFVALTAPLTEETRGLIGAAELRAMKPGAFLINVARGAMIQEAALIEALRERRIAGASLDVFDREPLPPESPLWELAVVTPHYSGGGPTQRREAAEEIERNLRRFVRGQELLYRINREDVPRA